MAAEGDIVALATLDDEIINGGTTHLRSLLVGMITGGTKFDNLEDYILDDLVEEEMERKKKEAETSSRVNAMQQRQVLREIGEKKVTEDITKKEEEDLKK